MRVVFHGVDDLVQLYDLTEDEKRDVDFGSYSADQFLDDMGRVTNYRCDPELTDILIGRSFETLKWMRTKGGETSSGPMTSATPDSEPSSKPRMRKCPQRVGKSASASWRAEVMH